MPTPITLKRKRNPLIAKKAILDAAESAFAASGYDGARFDIIAEVSGYNRSLICQYFENKDGLYLAVLARLNDSLNAHLAKTPNSADFQLFLSDLVGAMLDYLSSHPNDRQILAWEAAAQWQSYRRVASRLAKTSTERAFAARFADAQSRAQLRPGVASTFQAFMLINLCLAYTATASLHAALIPGEEPYASKANGRDWLVGFIVDGLIIEKAKEVL